MSVKILIDLAGSLLRSFPRMVEISFRTLIWLIGSGMASTALAAKPGELNSYQPTKVSGQPKFSFRYCPAGTIRPGKPISASEGGTAAAPIPVRDFYIGQTEVTLAQYRTVMGDSGLALLKQRAAKLRGIPELLELVQKGQEEPAFLVGLDGAVDFCLKLQSAFDDDRAQLKQRTIETRTFRLPSHVEWQYAARAVASADEQAKRPHFASWVSVEQISMSNQEKCKEVWRSLGRQGVFPGDQESFLMLGTSSSDQEKVKEIYTEVFEKAFRSTSHSVTGQGKLQPVGSTAPNDWNLTDMHEGVPEWAIWASQRDRLGEMWNRIAAARRTGNSLEGQDNIFLCGGSFMDSFHGRGLNRFTVWGGPKLTDEQPQPLTYEEANLVIEYAPGFRLVMERALADDWLLVLRRGIFQERKVASNASEYVSTNRVLADELVEPDHSSKIVLAFYNDLASSIPANRSGLQGRVREVSRLPAPATASGSVSGASKLSALLKKKDTAPAANTEVQESDEQVYFRTLASIMVSQPDSK